MLAFAFDFKLAAVHAYCLMDHPRKLGLRICYVDSAGMPKPSYSSVLLVARLLAANGDGVGKYVARTSGEGTYGVTVIASADSAEAPALQIVCACGDYDGRGATSGHFEVSEAYSVIKSSFDYHADPGAIPAGEWIVVQRIGLRDLARVPDETRFSDERSPSV